MAGAGTTNVLAWVATTKGVELFESKAVPDGVATEMKTVVNEQTIGDSMFNSSLQSVHVLSTRRGNRGQHRGH